MRVLSAVGEDLSTRVGRYHGFVEEHAPTRIVDEFKAKLFQGLNIPQLTGLAMNNSRSEGTEKGC